MNQVKKPMWFTLHSDSAELFEALRVRMDSRSPDSIGGKEFVCVSASKTSSDGVNAAFQELTRISTPWNGEGLPPVGMVCENRVGSYWQEVLVLAHDFVDGEHRAIFRFNGDGHVRYFGEPAEGFRPIRTAEQIAAEERENAVQEMLELDPYDPHSGIGLTSRAHFCSVLYDAGYRKFEIVEN